jgi:competence protein ComEC
VRGHVQKRLEQIFEDKEILAISQALLIGYKASLSQELVGAFSASGTMHVLAVSGLHAGIVFMVLNFLFLPFANSLNKNRIKVLVIVPSLFFYAFVTGLSPSVVRAAIMLSLFLIASALNRRGNIYNTIFATAFYMLLFNPMFLFHVGFQLSFLAVLGIVYFQPKIKRIYQAPNKVMLYLWEIVCVSIAAQLATFPLTLYYFHQFPSYFILSNLLVLPAVFLAMVFLFPSILFLNVSYIGPFFKIVTSFILGFISKSVVFVEDLPGSTVADIFLHPFYIFVLFCIVFLFGYFVYSSKAKWIISILVLILISGIFNAYDSYSKIYRKYVFKHRSLGIVVVGGNKLNILSDSSNLNNLELYSPKIQAIGSYYGVSKENIEHVWVRDIHNIKGVYFR